MNVIQWLIFGWFGSSEPAQPAQAKIVATHVIEQVAATHVVEQQPAEHVVESVVATCIE